MNQAHFASLDLNLLRVFDALMEERNVTRAGARLRLTQSAISHALNRLRYMLEDDLFVRGADGMQPTARAAEIGPRLRQALHHMQLALAPSAFEPRTTDRCFTIGATDYFSALLLPEITARLRTEAPHAELRVRPLDDIDIVDELDAGRMDVVTGSFGRVPERFAQERLYHDEMVWVLRADHPAADQPLTLDLIAQLPHLSVALAGNVSEAIDGFVTQHGLERRVIACNRGGVDKVLAEHGLSRRSHVTVPHFLSVPRVLATSDLIAMMPRRLAARVTGFYPLKLIAPPHDCASFEVQALWHARLGERADIAWFRALLRDVAAALDAAPARDGAQNQMSRDGAKDQMPRNARSRRAGSGARKMTKN
jgi:DNA-binding transcriptional LysR family regulator